MPEHPEMAVFATFTNVAKHPSKISALGEMADTSERLRQVRLFIVETILLLTG